MANGSGVELNLLEFKGTRDYEGIPGVLSNETNPNMSLGEVRKGLVRQIKAGLLAYTVESDLADKINDTIDNDEAVEKQDIDFGDPWNNWIFEIYGETQLERETSRNEFEYEFGFESDRVIEKWRIRADGEPNES